jgi:hypothetical protein
MDEPVYGCVGADLPENRPMLQRVDGILTYTCPACSMVLKEDDVDVDEAA